MPATNSHDDRQFVHLGLSKTTADDVRRDAREAGLSVIELGLEGVTSRDSLCDRLSDVFMYPPKHEGWMPP